MAMQTCKVIRQRCDLVALAEAEGVALDARVAEEAWVEGVALDARVAEEAWVAFDHEVPIHLSKAGLSYR